MPLLLFCAYATRTDEFIPAAGQKPWNEYLLRSFNGCCLFSSGFVLLITALVVNVEHKANGWRVLFSLPVSRSLVYYVKLAFTLAVIVVFTVLDAVFTLCLGWLLGTVYPQLGFCTYLIPKAMCQASFWRLRPRSCLWSWSSYGSVCRWTSWLSRLERVFRD